MADGMPPLVDRYAPRPPTMMSGWPPTATPTTQPPTLPSAWGGVENSPWGFQQTLTPMFPTTQPGFAPPQQSAPWPTTFGASPAVTNLPIAQNTANDDWVHLQRQDIPYHDYEDSEDSLGYSTLSRSLSRHSSHRSGRSGRSRTPFSHHSSPSSITSEISRSKSFTGFVSVHDKRPPREWRPDFTMASTSALGSAIGSILQITRPRSGSRRRSITTPRVNIHPYVRHQSNPPMLHDLRQTPDHVWFHDLNRKVNEWDMTRFVCEPPLPVMTFYNQNWPWYIEATSSNPSGVTLHDMFWAIWTCTQRPISEEDWYNNEMDDLARAKITDAYDERCGRNAEERSHGVRRVDYFMGRFILEGISKGKDGMFELKVRRPH